MSSKLLNNISRGYFRLDPGSDPLNKTDEGFFLTNRRQSRHNPLALIYPLLITLIIIVSSLFPLVNPPPVLAAVCDCSCYTDCGGGRSCCIETNCTNCAYNTGCSAHEVSSCSGGGGGCFLPGTQVATDSAGQTQNIENLKIGDQVIGFDEQTGETNSAHVAQIYEVQRDYYYSIETSSGDQVKVTAEHPFFVGFGDSQPGHLLTQFGLFFNHIYQSLRTVL
jgi:hypothetical protein